MRMLNPPPKRGADSSNLSGRTTFPQVLLAVRRQALPAVARSRQKKLPVVTRACRPVPDTAQLGNAVRCRAMKALLALAALLSTACADPSTPLAAFTAPTPILSTPQPEVPPPTPEPLPLPPPPVIPEPLPAPPQAPAVDRVRCDYVPNAVGDPNTFPLATPLNFYALDGIGPFTWTSSGMMQDTRPGTRQFIDLWIVAGPATVTVKDVNGDTASCRIRLQ